MDETSSVGNDQSVTDDHHSPRPRPSARISGGTPNGLPDYKPIKFDSAEFRALLSRPVKPVLYQVWVEDRVKSSAIPIGPKCVYGTATAFAGAISTQIALGREHAWANPTVVVVS